MTVIRKSAVGESGAAVPDGSVMSLEAYLRLAAARRNLAGMKRVKVTPSQRQAWKSEGQLIEL